MSRKNKCAFCGRAWLQRRAQTVYLLVLVHLFAVCLRISGKTDACFDEFLEQKAPQLIAAQRKPVAVSMPADLDTSVDLYWSCQQMQESILAR